MPIISQGLTIRYQQPSTHAPLLTSQKSSEVNSLFFFYVIIFASLFTSHVNLRNDEAGGGRTYTQLVVKPNFERHHSSSRAYRASRSPADGYIPNVCLNSEEWMGRST